MQSQFRNHSQLNASELSLKQQLCPTNTELVVGHKVFLFQANFIGCMDMYSDADSVASYLNAHEGWFCRCAEPMKVEPLGDNGYILTIGRFGSFGYEVEPKIALVLNLPLERVYTMHTIPVPNYAPTGYETNYYALMKLEEVARETVEYLSSSSSLPPKITQVSWELDLAVKVTFPKFIYKLPSSLIQKTGDRLLGEIVRQISPRLTYKVQQDFHTSLNLPIPPKNGRHLEKVDKSKVKV
jgi:hypothetical protein